VAADDATALRHNPALLARVEGMDLFLGHNSWIQDVRQEFAAFGLGGRTHHLGVGFGYVDYGAVEYRETASSKPLGTFNPSDVEVMVGYALGFDNLSVGATVRFLQQKILDSEATGLSADIGVWKGWPGAGITAGAVVQHLGSMGALEDESCRLPLTYRGAVAWRGPVGMPGVTAGFQVFNTPGIGGGAGLFAEFMYHGTLALRGGASTGDVAANWSLGAGVDLGRGSVDYAYLPVANDLGSSHRFSISLRP
jgi:hypothetical protein